MLKDLSNKKKIKTMNSKMTTNSQLSTTESKKQNQTKQTNRTVQIHRYGDHLDDYQLGGGKGRMGERCRD